MRKRNIAERFWENVDVRGDDECWNWIGKNSDSFGYGKIKFQNKSLSAHRVSMMFYMNDILKDGECVLHKCDNPKCVNPKHLYIGTKLDNARDRENRHRGYDRKGMNNNKHKFSDDDIRKIRELYSTKEYTQWEIARMFGVRQCRISSIVTRRTWNHI